MAVIQTDEWVREYLKESTAYPRRNPFAVQVRSLILPMAKYFPERPPADLHQYLLEQGLFYPNGPIDLNNWLEMMEQLNTWHRVKRTYLRLKKRWNGPKADIFIFPLEQRNTLVMNELGGKMGIGFQDKVVLFLAADVSKQDIDVVLTHEYHHVCRLSILNKPLDKLTLLDSLLVEGLAEAAVEQEYGDHCLGPWINLYSIEEALSYWKKAFIPYLNDRGKRHHHPFLYGHKERGLPIWIGYSIGYYMVASVMKQNPSLTTDQLLSMLSTELLEKSSFYDDELK